MQYTLTTSIDWVNGQVPSLENIVKKLDISSQNKKNEIIDHIIIEYDRGKGLAEKLEGKKFSLSGLFGLRRPVEYYRVDIYQNTSVLFTHQYKIQHPEYSAIEITIKFLAGALEGGESTLVKELMRRNSPSSLLQDKIIEWVKKGISEDITTLYTNFGQFSTRFTKYLAMQAGYIGLRLDATTTFKADGVPTGEIIRLAARDVEIQPKGYNDFLKLGFDVVLIPDKQLQSKTLVSLGHTNRQEFQDLLIKWMREYIRETITYNEITSYLHFKVRTSLIDYWNKQLQNRHKGWIVAELVLHTGDVPPSNFKFERLDIEVALRNAKIPLINTVILNLEDAERFKNSRVSNLETWMREKLQQTAQNILARVSYAELVSRINQLGSIIKSDLDKQAQQIGYRVEYLLTSELVDNARLNFQFQFGENEQVYQTSLNEMVKLNVVITGRIRSLDHDTWRTTLTPQTDFVLEMKKEVLRLVRQMLLRINADDFYTKFTESVEPKLVNSIKELLIDQFNVDPSVDISPQMELSELGILIKELQKGIFPITITCFKEALFKVSVSVSAVDPTKWALFANRSYPTADQIKEAIAERIRIYVESKVTQTVGNFNILRDKRFPELIKKYAMESNMVVRDKIGLIVDIIDVEELNGMNTVFGQKNINSAKESIEMLTEAIKQVNIKILQAIQSDDDEWELKQLKDKKTRLINELQNEQFNEYGLSFESGNREMHNLLTRNKELGEDKNDTSHNENDKV